MRAIQVSRFGGPEVLDLVDVPVPTPAAGEQLLTVSAAGVNFADTHETENTYLSPATLPLIPGLEVIGRLPDGSRFAGFCSNGYAEFAAVNPLLGFAVPPELSDTVALSLLVQGLTAWHLLKVAGDLRAGQTVLVPAAAGGVGSLAVGLARHLGAARIIALVSEAKAGVARDLGADETLDPRSPTLRADLRSAAGPGGVDLALEMTGGTVFDDSLASLGPFGKLITFGMASRTAPTPVAPGALMLGSHSIQGFWLVDVLRSGHFEDWVRKPLKELAALVATGALKALPGHEYPLAEAATAHRDLLARRTTGKIALVTA
jgi:NADPH2:quinone reductase